jgi:predicted flap endonuclease-1-like 5' DNA nuclease
MESELEDQVNIAIEFFNGRVKRDKWVDQAKEFLKES